MSHGRAWMEYDRVDVQKDAGVGHLSNRRRIARTSHFVECKGCPRKNGRPVGTRTPDLYRVKVAL
jgi:hypothetical protein